MLEKLTERRETFPLLDHRFIIKGYSCPLYLLRGSFSDGKVLKPANMEPIDTEGITQKQSDGKDALGKV